MRMLVLGAGLQGSACAYDLLQNPEVKQVRLVRDLVAGVSPSFAYVEIQEKMTVAEAVSKLDGHKIRERVILVREARKRGRAA